MIEIKNLTKSYGTNKGVFNLDLTVQKGEVFGFLGPNGAGKTTTIRHLLGFITPDNGTVKIAGKDCFKEAHTIQKDLGYIAGEIAFFNHMKGAEFLHFIAKMRALSNLDKMHSLIEFLELDIHVKIRKMSKGMKQKLGIVAALMHDPKILILDEPTSGLDPLMQNKFVELIKREKKQGKTILMSSHNFEEIERTCDRALIIKNGKKMALSNIKDLKNVERKIFYVALQNTKDKDIILKSDLKIIKQNHTDFEIEVSGNLDYFIDVLSTCKIKSLDIKKQQLEQVFMDYYKEGGGKDD